MRRLLTTAIALHLALLTVAQDALRGRVLDPDGEAAVGAVVAVALGDYATVTDVDGRFAFEGGVASPQAADGAVAHTLTVRYVGAAAYRQDVAAGFGASPLTIRLQASDVALATAQVTAAKASTTAELQPLSVESLDATQLRAQSLAVPEFLRRSSGLLVRRNGGVGSATEISLNGVTGPVVRVYYAGLPIEYYGGGLSLDVLPSAAIERVDVYKGVMPLHIGTDALGGGIDVVPRAGTARQLEASYEVGSFGLHRFTAAGGTPVGKAGYVGATAFVNRARNDYAMRDVPNRGVETFVNRFGREEQRVTEDTITARRFHDEHFSAYAEGRVGVADRPWVRLLELSVAGSMRDDELQNGRRVTIRPAGEATRERRALITRLRYGVGLGERASLDYSGVLSVGREHLRDSTLSVYDWRGSLLPITNSTGTELLARPTDRRGRTRTMAHRLSAGVDLGGGLRLGASEFYAHERIAGEDAFGVRVDVNDRVVDPVTVPATYAKLISGLELVGAWLEDERLRAVAFGKHYYLDAASVNIRPSAAADALPLQSTTDDQWGFGGGLRYALADERLSVKVNFERATRLPTSRELFGDFGIVTPNYALRPERSDNLNLGLRFHRTGRAGRAGRAVTLDANAFLRKQTNLIRLELLGGGELARFINEDEVDSRGLELTADVTPWRPLSLRANVTYQRIGLAATPLVGQEDFVGTQVPNIPRAFAGAGARFRPAWRLGPLADLTLFYDFYAVQRYSVTYVPDLDAANPDNVVPAQRQHDAGLTVAVPKLGLRAAFQVDNLTGADLFDNFRVPKPGRAYLLKLTYHEF